MPDQPVKTYLGWVPCVGGQVDITLALPRLHKWGHWTKNIIYSSQNRLPTERFACVATSSLVDWQDNQLTNEELEQQTSCSRRKVNGKTRVCVVARLTEQPNIAGQIVVIPDSAGGTHWQGLESLLENFQREAERDKPVDTVRQALETLCQELNELASGRPGGTLSHSIRANDITTPRQSAQGAEDDPSREAEEAQAKGGDKETSSPAGQDSPAAHPHPLEGTQRETPPAYLFNFTVSPDGIVELIPAQQGGRLSTEHRHIVARHCFYYIKYLFHRHVHHHHGDDSLTTLHWVDKGQPDYGLPLLQELKRGLITLKAHDTFHLPFVVFEMRGIIAYAKALNRILKKIGSLQETTADNEEHYLLAIGESVDVFKDKLQQQKSSHGVAHTFAAGIIMLLLAFLVPILYLFRDPIVKSGPGVGTIPPYLDWLSRIIHRPDLPVWLMGIMLLFYATLRGISSGWWVVRYYRIKTWMQKISHHVKMVEFFAVGGFAVMVAVGLFLLIAAWGNSEQIEYHQGHGTAPARPDDAPPAHPLPPAMPAPLEEERGAPRCFSWVGLQVSNTRKVPGKHKVGAPPLRVAPSPWTPERQGWPPETGSAGGGQPCR